MACGLRIDEQGATAADVLFVRSADSWQRAARSWLDGPTQEQALILVSVLVDSRPVWGIHSGAPRARELPRRAPAAALLRQLARLALSYRPPTGFLRGFVVEHAGEHRGRLDLKHGGLLPIVDLARWAGMAAGVTSASTPGAPAARRLTAGTLPQEDAHTLEDAFELFTDLRLAHQVEQLKPGSSRTTTSTRTRSARWREPPQGGFPGRRLGPEADRHGARARRALRLGRSTRDGPGARAYRAARCPAGGLLGARRATAPSTSSSAASIRGRDEIVSFGAVPIDDGRVQLGAAVEGLSAQSRSPGERSVRVHGLRAVDLADAPSLDEAIDPLLGAMAGRIPVVHAAAVERSFLRRALRRRGCACAGR